MRHVNDGELHAYLDGALDVLPEGRGEEVRDHLSRCSACRERLQDEEAIRDRSLELLASPGLPDLDLPAFEALRERAEAGRRVDLAGEEEARSGHRGPLRGLPLAWAATVILALGVGWMGGQLWRAVPQAPSPGEDGLAADAMGDPTSGRIPILESELPEEVRLADYDVGASEGRGKAAAAGEMAVPQAPVQEEDRERAEEPRMASEGVTSRLSLSPASGRGSSTETSGLTVPGLKVISVGWEEWAPGQRALHIRQALSPSDTLELRYLGLLMGTEPATEGRGAEAPQLDDMKVERSRSPAVLEASLPPGWNQVEMRWGKGWLVARAPLPESSIRALIQTLR